MLTSLKNVLSFGKRNMKNTPTQNEKRVLHYVVLRSKNPKVWSCTCAQGFTERVTGDNYIGSIGPFLHYHEAQQVARDHKMQGVTATVEEFDLDTALSSP